MTEVNRLMFEKFAATIDEGKKDGSISELYPQMGVYAGVFTYLISTTFRSN